MATQAQQKNPQQQSTTLPETGYIRLNQLLKIVPFSASTVWRKSKNGSFPAAVRLSDKITAWKCEEIKDWMTSKEAQ